MLRNDDYEKNSADIAKYSFMANYTDIHRDTQFKG